MTKKKIPTDAPTDALPGIQKQKWMIHEMISAENLPAVIMNNEEIGYKVYQIFPTGSYFALLVTLAK